MKHEKDRYDAFVIEADKINVASKRAIYDLTRRRGGVEVGPHDLYQIIRKKTSWIPRPYKSIDWDSMQPEDYEEYMDDNEDLPVEVKAAGPEDPDWRHGVLTVICKGKSEVPDDEIDDYFEGYAENTTDKECCEFIVNDFLPLLYGSPDKEVQKKIVKLKEFAHVLMDKTKSKESRMEAKMNAFIIWHCQYVQGPCFVTTWTGQQGDANIDHILTDLDVKIMAKLGPTSTWKKELVGTMNVIRTPMHPLKWKVARKFKNKTPWPFGMQFGGFVSVADPSRFTKTRDARIKRVARIQKNEWGRENIRECDQAAYNRDDYSFDLFLERKGEDGHYFYTCDVAPALIKYTDQWMGSILGSPDVIDWVNKSGLVYICGHDECAKLDMQDNLLKEYEALKRTVAKQKKEILKYKNELKNKNELNNKNDNNDTQNDGDAPEYSCELTELIMTGFKKNREREAGKKSDAEIDMEQTENDLLKHILDRSARMEAKQTDEENEENEIMDLTDNDDNHNRNKSTVSKAVAKEKDSEKAKDDLNDIESDEELQSAEVDGV